MTMQNERPEAVEAVARAIWEAQRGHWGRYRDQVPELCAWDDLSESRQSELLREAQAALAAARAAHFDEAAGVAEREGAYLASHGASNAVYCGINIAQAIRTSGAAQ